MMDGVKVIVAFVVAHAVANLAKVAIRTAGARRMLSPKETMRIILDSGGMPSAHTASFSGATMMVGLIKGFGSLEFAMMACVLVVIMYDAINVRYSVGEQGKRLNSLLREKNERELKVSEGHTIWQVLVGLVVGITTSGLVWLILKNAS